MKFLAFIILGGIVSSCIGHDKAIEYTFIDNKVPTTEEVAGFSDEIVYKDPKINIDDYLDSIQLLKNPENRGIYIIEEERVVGITSGYGYFVYEISGADSKSFKILGSIDGYPIASDKKGVYTLGCGWEAKMEGVDSATIQLDSTTDHDFEDAAYSYKLYNGCHETFFERTNKFSGEKEVLWSGVGENRYLYIDSAIKN